MANQDAEDKLNCHHRKIATPPSGGCGCPRKQSTIIMPERHLLFLGNFSNATTVLSSVTNYMSSVNHSQSVTNRLQSVRSSLFSVLNRQKQFRLSFTLVCVLVVVMCGGVIRAHPLLRHDETNEPSTPPPILTTYRYSDSADNRWMRVDVLKRKNQFQPNQANNWKQPVKVSIGSIQNPLPSPPHFEHLQFGATADTNSTERYHNNFSSLQKRKTTSTTQQQQQQQQHFSKELPDYVPPTRRAFFTPPLLLSPEFLGPLLDSSPTVGTNTNINYTPHGVIQQQQQRRLSVNTNDRQPSRINQENFVVKKKISLNTPATQSVHRLSDLYYDWNSGTTARLNESAGGTQFVKNYVPDEAITRILSGSNGRHDDLNLPDILRNVGGGNHVRIPITSSTTTSTTSTTTTTTSTTTTTTTTTATPSTTSTTLSARTTAKVPQTKISTKSTDRVLERIGGDESDAVEVDDDGANQLANVRKEQTKNMTRISTEEIWLICWNVHVYLVVFAYIVLVFYSLYQLIRYESEPHMFSKHYFLTVHVMLTTISVLRIFYLVYDPYNVHSTLTAFVDDTLHTFPLSLLACTFAVLILFLLKRSLMHLMEVNTPRPVFLVVFALVYATLCLCLSVAEHLGYAERAGLIVCRPIFVLLVWALGVSYLYLYRLIRNVLENNNSSSNTVGGGGGGGTGSVHPQLPDTYTQRIAYATHVTIAIAALFILLGFVQLYALFAIKVDRFGAEIRYHWVLWVFELSVRLLEISILALIAIVVNLKLTRGEKQSNANGGGNGGGGVGGGGFQLFPCTTNTSASSDSSLAENMYPNNCHTNPNAVQYSRSLNPGLDDVIGVGGGGGGSVLGSVGMSVLPTINNQTHEKLNKSNLLLKHDDVDGLATTLERYNKPLLVTTQPPSLPPLPVPDEHQLTPKPFQRPNYAAGFCTNDTNSLTSGSRRSSSTISGSTSSTRQVASLASNNTASGSAPYYYKRDENNQYSVTSNIYSEPIIVSGGGGGGGSSGTGSGDDGFVVGGGEHRRSRNASSRRPHHYAGSNTVRTSARWNHNNHHAHAHTHQQHQKRQGGAGAQTLPILHNNNGGRRSTSPRQQEQPESMLVDEQGFVRFRHLQDDIAGNCENSVRKSMSRDHPSHNNNNNNGHFSDT